MYSKITIIYGTKVPDKKYEKISDLLEAMAEDDEINYSDLSENGFDELYSGTGDCPVAYCGVVLDTFDVIGTGIPLSKLQLTATEKQKEKAKVLFDKIPLKVRKLLPPIDVYLIFHTS